MNVSFCCVRFSFFHTMKLASGNISEMTYFVSMGRKPSTQSVNQQRDGHLDIKHLLASLDYLDGLEAE